MLQRACTARDPFVRTPLRALDADQYRRVVRDVLSVPDVGVDLGPRASGVQGTFGMPVSRLEVQAWAKAAERVATATRPRLRAMVACDPAVADDGRCAREWIAGVGRRLFRRPLTVDELGVYQSLHAGLLGALGHEAALAEVLRALLQAPQFLYRLERGAAPAGSARAPLTGYEVATRLSLLVWGSAPDELLLGAADRGALSRPEEVRAQVWRMMAAPAAREGVLAFFERWLELDRIAAVTKDPAVLRGFDDEPRAALRQEPLRFVDDVLFAGDARLATLLGARWTFVNGRLAALYGLPGDQPGWRRVDLYGIPRAGLPTQPWLAATFSESSTSSPVLRGSFINRAFLCLELPPPLADVPPLPPPDGTRTTRERVAVHAGNPACAPCHLLIDPAGFALEGYDAVGRFRTHEAGKLVDTSGEVFLPRTSSRVPVRHALDLGRVLAGEADTAACLGRHWFAFAHGRLDREEDRCRIEELELAMRANGGNLRVLPEALAVQDVFLGTRPPESPEAPASHRAPPPSRRPPPPGPSSCSSRTSTRAPPGPCRTRTAPCSRPTSRRCGSSSASCADHRQAIGSGLVRQPSSQRTRRASQSPSRVIAGAMPPVGSRP